MTTRQGLIIGLQERYRAILKADYRYMAERAAYLRNFILEHGALAAIVRNLDDLEPDFDPAQWVAEHSVARQGIDLPARETAHAKLLWWLLGQWVDGARSPMDDGRWVSHEQGYAQIVGALVEHFIEPLVSYLQERMGEESDVLRLLARYKRRVEWFDRDRLFDEFSSHTSQGEAQYDRDLRRHLFDQGIDYPFSQPRSASGQADIVALLDTDDPLVLEVKLFDGAGRGVTHLASGVQQALRYAADYHKTLAFLVIFNLTDKHLDLPTDGDPGEWPPFLRIGNVKVNLVMIQALPLASASQQGTPQHLTIDADTLQRPPDNQVSG